MTPKPVRCPNCGRTSDETEFGIVLPLKGTWSGSIVGMNERGEMVIRGDQHDSAPSSSTVEVYCDCGHVWHTRRPWVSAP